MALRLCFLLVVMAVSCLAQDWPQWRGPKRDGVASAFRAPKTWPAELKLNWKATVGEGHSSPVMLGGRVFVFAREGEQEVVSAFDLESGKRIWRDGYPAPYEMSPPARGHGKGPKSTPLAEGGRLYTFGISGILSCYDIAKGQLLWRKEFSRQFHQTSPEFGTAMSPVIENGMLIVHAGGPGKGALMALDTATGAPRWTWDGDGPAYTSPIVITKDGVRQVITQTQENIVAVSAADGKLLWKLPFRTPYVQNIVTPVVYNDLLIFSGLDQGIFALRTAKQGQSWTATEAWRNRDVSLYMNSPVLIGSQLWGIIASW